MAARCTRCGAEAPVGATVCFMCGGQVAQAGPSPFEVGPTVAGAPPTVLGAPPTVMGEPAWGPAPQAGQAGSAPAWGPAPQAGQAGSAPAWGPAPGAWQSPGMGAAPGYGPAYLPGPMGGGPYAPAPARESNVKLGCGVAGCVGVLLVLLVVAGGLYYMLTQQQSTASETSASPGRRTTPQSGSLKSIVKEQVGPYRLVGNGDELSDDRLRASAVDSMGLKYRSDSGVEVKHFLVAYSSESRAQEMPQVMIEIIRERVPAGETFRVSSGPYSNRDGEVIGTKYHVQLEPELVIWTNGKLLAVVEAPPPHAVKFFEAVPY